MGSLAGASREMVTQRRVSVERGHGAAVTVRVKCLGRESKTGGTRRERKSHGEREIKDVAMVSVGLGHISGLLLLCAQGSLWKGLGDSRGRLG